VGGARPRHFGIRTADANPPRCLIALAGFSIDEAD
jgi:hypothetical protein